LPEWQNGGMDGKLDDVLAAVGPRLRALRMSTNTTLTALSGATGISVSTLSRLESGQRRPNLELLLPLAKAHQVPLDELVGAPDTGDPRVHLRPIVRNRMTIIPLTRRPGGIDTRVPHWFGRADANAVECLSLFGTQGERMHVRASRPSR
jgi:transcriptional regulator with XRE-family HTH domain